MPEDFEKKYMASPKNKSRNNSVTPEKILQQFGKNLSVLLICLKSFFVFYKFIFVFQLGCSAWLLPTAVDRRYITFLWTARTRIVAFLPGFLL